MMNMVNLQNQFDEFKKNFSGDPKEMVQQLLDSGKMSKEQFDQLKKYADFLQNMLK